MPKRKREPKPKPPARPFYTYTFSEVVENHKGMQKIGKKRDKGFSEAYIRRACEAAGGELHDLTHEGVAASVMVLRGGVDKLIGEGGADKLLAEAQRAPYDSKFLNPMITDPARQVCNKLGRSNNCIADEAQAPDIAKGKGTVVAFKDMPCLSQLREALPGTFGEEAEGLFAETNFYTDVNDKRVGIGFHGDTERSVVVGVRLGAASMPLRFLWYHKDKEVSDEHVIELHHGDVYAMSWKATGWDWRKDLKGYTLRHGTGQKAVRKGLGK
jgi:hypothetical protein